MIEKGMVITFLQKNKYSHFFIQKNLNSEKTVNQTLFAKILHH